VIHGRGGKRGGGTTSLNEGPGRDIVLEPPLQKKRNCRRREGKGPASQNRISGVPIEKKVAFHKKGEESRADQGPARRQDERTVEKQRERGSKGNRSEKKSCCEKRTKRREGIGFGLESVPP